MLDSIIFRILKSDGEDNIQGNCKGDINVGYLHTYVDLFLFVLQRKELGVLVYDCSCLALDLHRVFNLYWGLKHKDFIPSFWSKRLFALFNRNAPLEFTINSTKAQAYISVSDSESVSWHCI